MSKMNEAKMASLSDKIYDDEAEQELKREKKPLKKLIPKSEEVVEPHEQRKENKYV